MAPHQPAGRESALAPALSAPLNLLVPDWGAALLAIIGGWYLVFGGRWATLFDVLSLTVLGCGAGLLASAFVPLPDWLLVVIGGVVVGGLAAFFRTIAHVVLAAAVFAVVLATLTALALPEEGFATYLLMDVRERAYEVSVRGPNLAADRVLAAALAGLLGGATVAVLRFRFSRHLVTAAQGAALVVLGVAHLAATRATGAVPLHEGYPLTLASSWMLLTGIGIVVQRVLCARRDARTEAEPFGPDEDESNPVLARGED